MEAKKPVGIVILACLMILVAIFELSAFHPIPAVLLIVIAVGVMKYKAWARMGAIIISALTFILLLTRIPSVFNNNNQAEHQKQIEQCVESQVRGYVSAAKMMGRTLSETLINTKKEKSRIACEKSSFLYGKKYELVSQLLFWAIFIYYFSRRKVGEHFV